MWIILFALCQSATSFGQQSLTIDLRDTVTMEKRVSYRGKKIVCPDSIACIEKGIWNTVSLSPSSFLWGKQVIDSLYYEVLYSCVAKNGNIDLFMGNSSDTTLHKVATFLPAVEYEINLTFIPIDDSSVDTVYINTLVKVNTKEELTFYPIQLFSGKVDLRDTTISFYVWPYQTGPFIRIIDSSKTNITSILSRYNMDEPFIIGDQIIRFKDFEYTRKKITVVTEESEENPILYGYKAGYYLKGWHIEGAYLDSLNIPRNKPLMIYFGGSWCPPCLEETPRLKRVANICEKYNISVLSVAVLFKDTELAANTYLKEHELPGMHLVEKGNSVSPTLREYLQISSFPTYVFIDAEGKIVRRFESREGRDKELHRFLSQFISILNE